MLVIDIVLIVLLVLALVVGLQRGLLASLGVLIGIVLGGLAAFWLVPIVNELWPWPTTRVVAVIALVLVLLVAGATAIGAIGAALRRGVDRTPLRAVDRLLGGALAVLAGALSLSLIGSSVAATGTPVVSTALKSSQVLRTISSVTPAPVAEALARVRSAVMEDALPRLGELLELDIEPSAPPVALDDPLLADAAASVARVSGVAFACGTSAAGSGFVIAPDRVVTNAHVVAGVQTPIVELPGVPAREGRIVYFDPIDDLAVIAVDGLGASPLPVVPPLSPGTAGVIQGYPFGGPFSMVNAEVISAGAAEVPDIYGESTALRDIYALAAQVNPGNSGGPLLTADGAVGGVVFARAEADSDRGYAMTTAELEPILAGATGWTDAASSGRCIG
ncbi:MarP family serine protease [Microbacterium sp. zg.B48]|uniref:MarP family serine protease n=1 Tax=Microbacterium sp. zg.B48 TaxID=2969408 RepID=UPI00214ADEB1|nr:MarP family serine protease [Microbacterium sp. zg.B48]MCR2762246.1 MarP family serine protease [Microbacterium sp. zg.B48]